LEKFTEEENDDTHTTQKIPAALGERMKYYEHQSEGITMIDPSEPFIVRIDGRAFSKYTKNLKKLSEGKHDVPYSPEFKRCMLLTASSLLHEFRPSTVYTHSDEITLIFPPALDKDGNTTEHPYAGKTRKLLSLIPSFASNVFADNVNRELELVYGIQHVHKSVSDQLQSGFKCSEVPTFDARIITFPEPYEIVNCIMWRSKGDCTRNFVSMFSDKYLSKKSTHNVSTNERKRMLLLIGYDMDGKNVDLAMKHGVMMKINSEKRGPSDNTFPVFYTFENFTFSDDMLNFLLAKNSSVGVDNLATSRPMIHDFTELFFSVPSNRVDTKEPEEKKIG